MWSGRVLSALALVWARTIAEQADSRTVNIEQGPVKGYRAPEGDYFVFYNIPYATAPTGKDKFKAPLPAPKWNSTFEAVDRGVVCPQIFPFLFDTGGANKTIQEDCLIAHVYVPDTDKKSLPVVFYVHGGAYQVGEGILPPRTLVQSKKVIYVTFNYRLGVYGFLCLGTPDAPGNAGMKDMVAALRWVHSNIASFGGNPDDVTIQGSSAGSSAVDLLLLSKTTKGLFCKAIPESGANVATWSVQIDPIANAKEFAKNHNFNNTNDIYALEEFYKTAPLELLTKDTFAHLTRKENDFVFAPCVERDTGVEIFLDDYPVNILKKGDYNKVPMLYGFANMEGLFRIPLVYNSFKDGMNQKFSDYLPRDLKFENEEEKENVAKSIKEFYFDDKEVGGDTILEYINYFTDIMFAYPMLRSVKLQVESGNDQIYLYQFSFPLNMPPMPEGSKPVSGANHCAQTTAVFDLLVSNETNTDDYRKVKNITQQFWLNFITTGTPVPANKTGLPTWPTTNGQRSPYMEINVIPQLEAELLAPRALFWDAIYSSYYRAPVAPPTPPAKTTTENCAKV